MTIVVVIADNQRMKTATRYLLMNVKQLTDDKLNTAELVMGNCCYAEQMAQATGCR